MMVTIKENKIILFLIFYIFVISCNSLTAQSQIDTKTLIDQLKDEKWNIRAKAVEALGEGKDASTVGLLIEAINDQHPFVRLKAIEALAKNNDKKVIPFLIKALNDSNLNNHKAAIEALGEKRAIEAVGQLISEIKYNDSGVRWRVAEALGKIKSPTAVETLITALQDESSEVRSEAAYALGEIKDIRTVEFLINVLKDESEDIRYEAAIALGNIGDSRAVEPLIPLLIDKNSDVSTEAKTAIAKIGEPAITPLIDKLYYDELKDKAIETLVLIGKSAAGPLGKRLNDKNYSLRETVRDILIKLDYEPDVISEKITFMIAKRDWDGCVKIGKEAVPQLINTLDDERADVRIEAVNALGEIGDNRAIAPLFSLYNKPLPEFIWQKYKNALIDALGKMGPESLNTIITAVRDKKMGYGDASRVLSKMGKPVIKSLIALLDDENDDVKIMALNSLGVIDVALETLENEDSCKFTPKIADAISSIEDSKNDLLYAFADKLNDKNETVRVAAALALVKSKDPRALETLIEILKTNTNFHDKRKISGVLVNMVNIVNEEDRRAINSLIVLLDDKDPANLADKLDNKNVTVRMEAALALARKKDIRALEPLIEILKTDIGFGAKQEILRVLANIEDSRAINPLVSILLDVDKRNYNYYDSECLKALDKLGWKPESIEEKVLYYYERGESDKCVSLGKPAAKIIINKYTRQHPFHGIYVLLKIGQPAVDALIDSLKNDNKDFQRNVIGALDYILSDVPVNWPDFIRERNNIIRSLGGFDNSRAINHLFALGEDEKSDINNRLDALEVLSKIKDKKSSDFLISLINDKNVSIRNFARGQLAEAISPPIDPLINQLKIEDIIVTPKLIEIGAPAVEKLIIALEDSDNRFRKNAAYILGEIKDNRAVQPLINKLKDKDLSFRKVVVEALIKLKWVPLNDEEKAVYYISDQFRIKALNEELKLNKQAIELYKDGKYDEAISYVKKALELPENVLNYKYLDTDYYGTEFHYKYGYGLREEALKTKQVLLTEVAQSRYVLAEWFRITGSYSEAEMLYKRAIEIYIISSSKIIDENVLNRKVFPLEESRYDNRAANIFNKLALVYEDTGRDTEAEPLYLLSLKLYNSNISGIPAACLNDLAAFYDKTERYSLAHTNFMSVIDIRKKNIDNIFSIFSERQKMEYLNNANFEMNYFLSHVSRYQLKDINFIRDGLDAWLQWKGIVTESQSRYEDLFSDTKDPNVLNNYNRLIEVKKKIVKLAFSGSGKIDDKEYRENLSTLEKEKEEIEVYLSKMSKAYTLEKKIGQIDSKSIAKMLPKNSYLIEFACPDFYNFKDRKFEGAHYLAFILSSDEGKPVVLVDLGKADNINKLIEEYRVKAKEIMDEEEIAIKADISGNRELRDIKIEGVFKESKKSRDEMAKKLYNNILAPLKDYLGDGKNIFVSLEGSLNFIPFEVLISQNGQYLIDEYQFNYITAGRDLMRFNAGNEASNNEMIIMADPDFDLGTYKDNVVLAKLEAGEKENLQFSREMRGVNFGRLSGTREEGEAISNILKDKYGKEPKLYLGDQALEGVLMNNKNPKILHIASHGFFLTDEMMDILISNVSDSTRGLSDEEMRNISIIENKVDKKHISIGNPMLRSGIALSGANTSLNSGRDKGILVAEKISGLRLRGTELVVLSACDTGVGEVKKGEGVFGLKRAFILAGAKTLVMSLWKVPDEETKDLMIEFYKRMADGKSKAEALREAKLKIKEKNPNPFYWGGFVAIGDPD